MQITIVDDDTFFVRDVINTLNEFFSQRNQQIHILHQKGAELVENLKNGRHCDLCLLDVEMADDDGLALAEKIRQISKNIKIVFLTVSEKYAIFGYRVNANGYILKESYRENLFSVLQCLCRDDHEISSDHYIFQTDNHGCKIHMADILYLKKEGKYTLFKCVKAREYRERQTLKNVYENLPQEKFVFIDKSTIVNLSQITEYTKKSLVLRDGTMLWVSRGMWPSVKDKIYSCWKG